jgi:hypothetical protein
MRERIKILCTICQEEWRIINHCNEIYGAYCQHKTTRFHRFLKEHTDVKNTSTDEGERRSTSMMIEADLVIWIILSKHHLIRCTLATDVTPPLGALDICTLILICV